MDPATVQGLLVASQSIAHAAGDDEAANPQGGFEPLALGPGKNLSSWEPWVRASLYLTDVLRELDWTPPAGNAPSIAITFAGGDFATLARPDIDLFRRQLAHLRAYADQRADRASEILTQVGFPTPYFASLLGLNARNPRTLELIAIAQVIAAHVAMLAKHHLACRRPDRLGAGVMPMIVTPGHGSFPSAHAAEAFAVRTVLSGLLDNATVAQHYPRPDRRKALLAKQAERIAVNRTVAGMHFPIDSWAGAALGEAVGAMILTRCGAAAAFRPRSYTAQDTDFFVKDFDDDTKSGQTGLTRGAARNAAASPLFEWLWAEAVSEFALG